jgi:uncharacterized protein YqgV (UPF0045/DUF77 family)
VKVSAQISLYPLRQERLGPAIETLRLALERQGLEARVGPMSTLVTGDSGRLFTALREGFERVAERGQVAMVVTVSNACPTSAR